MGELFHPEVEIRTERAIHRGRDAAIEWSGKTFDNLERRYVPISIEQTDEGVLVRAEVHYVWRESGEVAERTPVAIELGIRDGMISSWSLLEEPS